MSIIKVNAVRNTATNDGGIDIDASGHVQIDGVQLPTAGALSHRNLVVNGAMQVAQRATSVTGVADGVSTNNEGYNTLDRFGLFFANTAGGVCTVSQDTDVPSNEGFSSSYKVLVTTADTSVDATHMIYVAHKVEAQNVRNSGWNYTSSSSYVTLSFWVKSNKPGTYVVAARANDAGAIYYPFEYTLTANTWQKVTHSFPGDSSLVINNDNGIGFELRWYLAVGADRDNATANQWNADDAGNAATSNQVNFFESTSNDFYLTGVQLEVGSKATAYEHRAYSDELARCQRYFHKSGEIGTAGEWFPGVQTNAEHGHVVAMGMDGLNDRAIIIDSFPTTMRAPGTAAFYPGRDGVTNDVDNITIYNSDSKVTTSAKPTPTTRGFEGYFVGTSSDSRVYSLQYTVDSEL